MKFTNQLDKHLEETMSKNISITLWIMRNSRASCAIDMRESTELLY